MTDFYFDGNKNSSENFKAFLEVIKAEDPQMAAILQDNWDALVAVVRKGQRDSRARGEFNSSVAAALDSLVRSDEPKDSS
ncbi:MAG: hypothetical protein OXI63_23250 [Candidatus Poribacteria bacterium]|nr:hypothetical protein [Candidatus Poribacteria bacterium]